MEYIKIGEDRFLIKNSNSKVVDEKELLELQNKELVLEDITGKGCQEKTTKKIKANKKRIEDIETNTIEETTPTVE